MIAAFLLAACLQPPIHNQVWNADSIPCTTERESVECGCSDFMRWPRIVGADYYRIERRPASALLWSIQGDTLCPPTEAPTHSCNHPAWIDDAGEYHPEEHQTLWVFYWDVAPAAYGTIYEYRIVPIGRDGLPLSTIRCAEGPCLGEIISLATVKWNPSPVRYIGDLQTWH